MGMVYGAAAHSVGLLMANAVFNEKVSQIRANASVDQCCALIIAAGATGATGATGKTGKTSKKLAQSHKVKDDKSE